MIKNLDPEEYSVLDIVIKVNELIELMNGLALMVINFCTEKPVDPEKKWKKLEEKDD